MISNEQYFLPLPKYDWKRTIKTLRIAEVDDDPEDPDESINPAYMYIVFKVLIEFDDDIDKLELYPTSAANVQHIIATYNTHDYWTEESWGFRLKKYDGLSIEKVRCIVCPGAEHYETHKEDGVLSLLFSFSDGSELQIITANICSQEILLGGDDFLIFDHEHYSLSNIRSRFADVYLVERNI